jgi:pyrimidine operon attenuation protein / uracil phosphoribosyltransferase
MQLDAEQLIDVLAEKLSASPRGRHDYALIGIHTGGAWVADRLAAKLGVRDCGKIAVTLHRDDYATRGLHHSKHRTDIGFSVDGRHIVLVDDVLQTGRTIRAALNELFDFGRPQSVTLAVLIDRGGRELPFAADVAAMTMALDPAQQLELTNNNNTLRFLVATTN